MKERTEEIAGLYAWIETVLTCWEGSERCSEHAQNGPANTSQMFITQTVRLLRKQACKSEHIAQPKKLKM